MKPQDERLMMIMTRVGKVIEFVLIFKIFKISRTEKYNLIPEAFIRMFYLFQNTFGFRTPSPMPKLKSLSLSLSSPLK